MNTAESTATVELACGKKSEDAHWENLLTYCKQGNIQAMFDEYAHLITNGLDADNNLVDNLHYTIASSMDVRTTIYTIDTFNAFKARANGTKEKPTAIIAKTVKGKGVSFMENNAGWHGKAPNDEEYATAMADLEKIGAELGGAK